MLATLLQGYQAHNMGPFPSKETSQFLDGVGHALSSSVSVDQERDFMTSSPLGHFISVGMSIPSG